ncbi:MAG: hypothetical protein AAB893_03465, partial [Patescibacteria group bacterium]
YLYNERSELIRFLTVKEPLYLILSFLLLFPSFLCMFWAREQLTSAMNIAIDRKSNWNLFCRNMMTRYIPGGIWNQLEAVMGLKTNGNASIKQGGKLVVLEMFWRAASGILFFGLFILNFQFSFASWRINFQIIIIYPILILLFVFGVWTFSSRYPFIILYSIRNLFFHLVANFLFYVSNGISFYFLIRAFYPLLNIYNLVSVISASTLGWVAGFLFVPAPSGLGVREAVTGYLLSSVINIFALGFSITLLHRILILARDVVIYVVTFVYIKGQTFKGLTFRN